MHPDSNSAKYLRWALNGVLGVVFIWELVAPDSGPWLYPALVTVAAMACIAGMTRRLPLQNVLMAAAIVALIGGAAHSLTAKRDFGIPFGPIGFQPGSGDKIFGLLPWTMPLLWIVAVFTARGVMRLILRPWRKTKTYGWWLIGLTAALVLAFDAALEPFAHVRHLWFWQLTKISLNWQSAPIVDLIGWYCVTLLILAFISPFLIKKQPGRSSGSDIQPLIIWLGTLLLFAVAAAGAKLWLPVTVDAAVAAVTLVLAIRGVKW